MKEESNMPWLCLFRALWFERSLPTLGSKLHALLLWFRGLAKFAKLRETELSGNLFGIHPNDIQCHPDTKTPKFLRPSCTTHFNPNNFKRKSMKSWHTRQPLMQDSVASPRLSAGYGRFPAQGQVWQLCYRTFNIFYDLSMPSTAFTPPKSC